MPSPAAPQFSEPLIFTPLFMERIWGGRRLETLFGKKLPTKRRIGESWEIVDRPEAQSVVCAGAWSGKTLHELWLQHRREVFGASVIAPNTSPMYWLFLRLSTRWRIVALSAAAQIATKR